MRLLLYLNPEPSSATKALVSAFGPVASALPLEGLVEEVRRQEKETSQTIVWSRRSADAKFDDVLIYLFGPIDPRRGSIWSFYILI